MVDETYVGNDANDLAHAEHVSFLHVRGFAAGEGACAPRREVGLEDPVCGPGPVPGAYRGQQRDFPS